MIEAIKKIVPLRYKKVLWYIFKFPLRHDLGYSNTYKVEFRGFLSALPQMAGAGVWHKLQPVSICTGLKNRSGNYLEYVLGSINKMKHRELIELCIFDCGSSDIPSLEAEIRRQWNGKLKFMSEERPFTRSYTFNRAIALATSPIIFACDADMTLPENLVVQCNRFVSRHSVWFPICFNLNEHRPAVVSPENGEWLPIGKGMFASYKWQFEKIGGFDESFVTWGGEDTEIWERFWKFGFLPIRNQQHGFFHNYHPSLKPVEQKV